LARWVLLVNAAVRNDMVTQTIGQSGLGVASFQMFFFAAFAFVAALAFGLYAARSTLADHYRTPEYGRVRPRSGAPRDRSSRGHVTPPVSASARRRQRGADAASAAPPRRAGVGRRGAGVGSSAALMRHRRRSPRRAGAGRNPTDYAPIK